MRIETLILILLIPSATFSDEFESSVVNLSTCSGVVIVKGKEKAYGVSASHCVTAINDTFKITTHSGKTSSARWLAQDASNDLALFVCWAGDVDAATPVLSSPPEKSKWIAIGFPAHNSQKQITSGAIFVDTKDIIQDDGKKIEDRNHFTLTDWTLRGGESGGAVFAKHERAGVEGLIGIISHGRGTKTLLASSNNSLLKFLKTHEPKMSLDCQKGYCEKWDAAPPPPESRDLSIGSHDLPEFLDSDRERGLLIQKLLSDVLELQKQKLVSSIGKPGSDGSDGLQGAPGTNGKDGADGNDGADGKDADMSRVSGLENENAALKLEIAELKKSLQKILETKTLYVLSEGNKIVQKMEYGFGEPVVLDSELILKKN